MSTEDPTVVAVVVVSHFEAVSGTVLAVVKISVVDFSVIVNSVP